MRISDWSSDVCSSDLTSPERLRPAVLRCSIREACFQGVSRGSARRGAWFSICFTLISGNVYRPPQSTGKGSAGERHDQRRRKAGERIGGERDRKRLV